MKKKLLFIVLVAGLCGTTGAKAQVQETIIDIEQRLPGYKTTFEANPFWHNWFISANFGANTLFAEHWKDPQFKNTLTFMPTLSVGKWFNPWWGLRLQGGGGSLHGFTEDAQKMIHMHYMHLHADFMLGLINFFAPYKENRRFDIVPFAGIGGMTRKKDQSFIIDAGIQLRYAISPRFDVNIEYQGMILDDDLVVVGGFPNDGISGLTAGFTYRFKNREFKRAPRTAEVMALAEANLALANKVAQLQNQKPQVKIVEKEVIKKEVADVYKTIPSTIPFKFNSAVIQDVYDPLLYNIGTFLKENPNMKARIIGYADKFGPINVNLKISEERAKAVAKVLTSEYGINPNRLMIEYVGKEKPYYKNDNKWNRCAIVDVMK